MTKKNEKKQKDIEVTPVENDIEKIKKLIDEGGHITIPPDNTPIHNIPFTPPEKPNSEPLPPIDWDEIKRILKRGGKIKLHEAAEEKPKKKPGKKNP